MTRTNLPSLEAGERIIATARADGRALLLVHGRKHRAGTDRRVLAGTGLDQRPCPTALVGRTFQCRFATGRSGGTDFRGLGDWRRLKPRIEDAVRAADARQPAPEKPSTLEGSDV